jgi:hypothetical protein
VVFVPRKFQAKTVAGVAGDLWGYLVGGREQADYYLGADGTPTEATARLHGRLWARLGLARLDRVGFGRLAVGCQPLTGQRLIKTSHVTRSKSVTGQRISMGGCHVPGIDCNLSPPKSVSALLPFVSPWERAELERAHLTAVRVTLEELEARVAACRPTVNGKQVHTPGELGVAVFTHHTSRPTGEVAAEAGRPPDPQLHSHAFVFNLAFCQGRYLAVDSRPIYQFATTAEAIMPASSPPSSSASATGWPGGRPAMAAAGSWPGSTGGWPSCSPAAIGSSISRPPSSRSGGVGRRRCGSAADCPPATAPPRPTPAGRRIGPPTAPSWTVTASTSPPRRGSGRIPCRWPSGRRWCGRGCWPLTGSPARTPPSARPR